MLNNLKMLLGIPKNDTDRDELLEWLIESAGERLKNLLGGRPIPESMNHIIVEAAVIRFNRIGSEGLSSHSVAGESLSFTDSDFAGFADEIQAYLDSLDDSRGQGGIRFL